MHKIFSSSESQSFRKNNGGFTLIELLVVMWVDSPAAFHVRSADFNFCDGHAENHRWLNQATIQWANDTTSNKDGNPG